MQPQKLELTQAQLQRIAQRKAQDQATKVDSEWLAIAEFGMYFGWQAVKAVLNDTITSAEMFMLLEGARKVNKLKLYNETRAVFIGTASANSKKPSQTFKRMTKDLIRESKPNNE